MDTAVASGGKDCHALHKGVNLGCDIITQWLADCEGTAVRGMYVGKVVKRGKRSTRGYREDIGLLYCREESAQRVGMKRISGC